MYKLFPVLATLFALVVSSPTGTIEKRATYSDAATIGYASTNGGTTGGAGGTVVTVSTLADFEAAVDEKDTTAKIVLVSGTITGSTNVRIGSNKSIIGLPGATFNGVGLYLRRQSNIIIRNIISANVLASTKGDGIRVDETTNVWIDHCELYSDLTHDKDYYDGLLDASHAADFITVSYTYFHDHWKTSLIGHSDNNAAEDTGHLRITYANNYWENLGSRGPSLRFGTGHVYNNYYKNMNTAVDSRDGAQVLVESSVFSNVTEPIASLYSDDVGYVTAKDNILGGAANTAPAGTITDASIPYKYTLLGSANVAATVPGQAGAKLTW
ncbi:unnamed protein product [Discula destructiva]